MVTSSLGHFVSLALKFLLNSKFFKSDQFKDARFPDEFKVFFSSRLRKISFLKFNIISLLEIYLCIGSVSTVPLNKIVTKINVTKLVEDYFV